MDDGGLRKLTVVIIIARKEIELMNSQENGVEPQHAKIVAIAVK